MADPNIDMIADSLRRCSLGPGAAASPPLGPEEGEPAGDAAADTPLQLNSDVALPYHWEQCLDLKTGKIYYINWSTGVKTTEDPRKLAGIRGDYVSGDEDGDADDEGDNDDDEASSGEEEAATSGSDDGDCSSAFSPSSSAFSRGTTEGDGGGGGPVLVAAGCRVCMMYVMIPKRATECPRCGGPVIHFGRSGNR